MKYFLTTTLALCFAAQLANAQDGPRPWYISTMASGINPIYKVGAGSNIGIRKFEFLWGRLGIAKRISNSIALEASWSRGDFKLQKREDPLQKLREFNALDFNVQYLFANGRTLPLDNRWSPFVQLGVGAVDIATNNPKWKPLFTGGGGVDYWFNNWLGAGALVTVNLGTGHKDEYLQYSLGLKFRIKNGPVATAAIVEEVVVAPAPAPAPAPEPEPEPTPAPVPPPAPAPVMEAMKDVVYFGFDEKGLDADDKAALDKLVDQLKTMDVVDIKVTGYTDNIGTPQINQVYANARAEAVKAYLVSKGVDASKITTLGEGDKDFVAPNNTRDGRAQNRRTEVVVDYKK